MSITSCSRKLIIISFLWGPLKETRAAAGHRRCGCIAHRIRRREASRIQSWTALLWQCIMRCLGWPTSEDAKHHGDGTLFKFLVRKLMLIIFHHAGCVEVSAPFLFAYSAAAMPKVEHQSFIGTSAWTEGLYIAETGLEIFGTLVTLSGHSWLPCLHHTVWIFFCRWLPSRCILYNMLDWRPLEK